MDASIDHAGQPAPSRGGPGLFYHYLMQACGLLSGLIIGVISLLIVYNVIVRNLGFGSVGWIMEGSEYAVAAATFLGAPWVLYQGAHVRIDLLLNSLPPHLGRWLETCVNGMGAVIAGVFLYFSAMAGAEHYQRGTQVFKAFVFPEWWTFIVPVVCFALIVVEFLRRFGRSLRGEN